MYARPDEIDRDRARRSTVWLGTGVLLLITVAMALIGRAGLSELEGAWTMAGIVAVGTFAIGWLCGRVSPYPRWAWFASAGIMAIAVLASVARAEPAVWRSEVRSVIWMLPWFLLTVGILPPAKAGACAPAHPRAGWVMVLGSLLIALFLTSLPAISSLVRGR